MGIIRTNKTTGSYFIASKSYVEDETLSWKAKGLMSYLFSKPDDWKIYQTQLTNVSTDGKAVVRNTINELLERGYMTRTATRKGNGDFDGYEYTLHESPYGVRFMEDAKMEDAKMVFAKPDTTNNNLTNNNLTNNNSNIVEQARYKEIIEYLNNKTGKRYSYKSKANQKLIKTRMNEGYTLEDFIKVIDNKVMEWQDNEKMKSYLQPTTLFSNKFDKYLNQELSNKPIENVSNNFFSQLTGNEV
ncbi:conserved phage C-terminal domain-containing protein [Staphylococcus shinii]|uniref:conserved phage C-terminal domain-containing protein n=1 Tax=Staphylococcus shinii TaxID=2912228 RepID=UPI00298EF8E1|nr:conserved phage C-terminal domain-containing protein [Staphylococcus shinii]MDW8564676.1 conserved phage C-terminal domain-containing protein [Staphylococcus shinii]